MDPDKWSILGLFKIPWWTFLIDKYKITLFAFEYMYLCFRIYLFVFALFRTSYMCMRTHDGFKMNSTIWPRTIGSVVCYIIGPPCSKLERYYSTVTSEHHFPETWLKQTSSRRTCCNTPQHPATPCNKHCNTLCSTHCNTHCNTCCNTLCNTLCNTHCNTLCITLQPWHPISVSEKNHLCIFFIRVYFVIGPGVWGWTLIWIPSKNWIITALTKWLNMGWLRLVGSFTL